MNKAAQTLGRLAKGKPKTYSTEELAKRILRLVDARAAKAKADKKRIAEEKRKNK